MLPRWPLQPFERELAAAEAETLAAATPRGAGDHLVFDEPLSAADVQRLARRMAFAAAVEGPAGRVETTQSLLERAAGGNGRKVTSHALHGLHPYKGKFYPQLARSLLNVCGAREGALMVDPFAGSGTAVLEAGLLGVRGVGVDANPMAVMVSEAKLRLLECRPEQTQGQFSQLRRLPAGPLLPHDGYLARWFPAHNLEFLRRAVAAISQMRCRASRLGAAVTLSSLLREASWQDPQQLRVRRRRSEDMACLEEMFYPALDMVVEGLAAALAVGQVRWAAMARLNCKVVAGDSRDLAAVLRRHIRRRADAVATSPPYAGALPYIDTDRLALHAFGLLPQGGQREAETAQIGNREITASYRRRMEQRIGCLAAADRWMPESLRELLHETLETARDPRSGFRKRRTPAVLYSYFNDMRSVLAQISDLLRDNAKAAIVIGANSVSSVDGTAIRVPSPEIISEIAATCGLMREAEFSKRLTSYAAKETVHHRNAMPGEQVLVLTREPRSASGSRGGGAGCADTGGGSSVLQ